MRRVGSTTFSVDTSDDDVGASFTRVYNNHRPGIWPSACALCRTRGRYLDRRGI